MSKLPYKLDTHQIKLEISSSTVIIADNLFAQTKQADNQQKTHKQRPKILKKNVSTYAVNPSTKSVANGAI